MAVKKSKQLVNVIGSVDLKAKSGRIMYVNPGSGENSDGTSGQNAGPQPTGGQPALGKAEIVMLDNMSVEVGRVPADLHVSSCKPGEIPVSAIINQDIPLVGATRRLILELDGKPVAEFVTDKDAVGSPQASASSPRAMGLGPPVAGKPHHQPLDVAGADVTARAGVSFTVQIAPDDSKRWETIAVGVDTPNVDIDRHQFQGAKRLRIRVLRSTGLSESLFAEDELDLTK